LSAARQPLLLLMPFHYAIATPMPRRVADSLRHTP